MKPVRLRMFPLLQKKPPVTEKLVKPPCESTKVKNEEGSSEVMVLELWPTQRPETERLVVTRVTLAEPRLSRKCDPGGGSRWRGKGAQVLGCRARASALPQSPARGSPQPALPGQCHPSRVFLPQGPALGTYYAPRGSGNQDAPTPPLHPAPTACPSPDPPSEKAVFQEMLRGGGSKRKMGERRMPTPPPPLWDPNSLN